MKKTLLVLIAGITISTSTVWAAGLPAGAADRIVAGAAAHPRAVQAGASAIASRPAAQARMDAAMAANPTANDLMRKVQQAGGYTPPAK